MTVTMAAPSPRPPAPERPTASWSSGRCTALTYDFELRLPWQGDFVSVFSPLLHDFRGHEPLDASVPVYEVVPRRPGDPHDAAYGLHLDDRCLGAGSRAADLSKAWGWNLNRAVIGSATTDHVVLHAACVTLAGITVVLAADMESGKTTTTAGLLRAGYEYVTDEATAIDPCSGRVRPFPKPLSLDPGSWPLFPELRGTHLASGRNQWQVNPRALGSRAWTRPVDSPQVVVFPRYRPGVRTAVRPVSTGEALLELTRMTFDFGQHPRRNLDALAALTARARCVRLDIGDLEPAVSAIDDLVSTTILEDL